MRWLAAAPLVLVLLAAGAVITVFVSRSRSARERLRQLSEERGVLAEQLTQLVELAPEGLFVADLDGRYLDVNAAGCRLLGYSREELTHMSITDVIAADDVARLERDKAELLGGHIATNEWRLRRKDGTFVETQITARILPDGHWQAVVHDISERKRLEEALQAKSADFERAQSVAQVGSWRIDAQRHELHLSNETYRIFERPIGSELSYESFLSIVHPDDREYVDRQWQAALRGAFYDIEHRLLVGGRTKWVRERADLEFDDRGVLLGGIGISQDITERKRLEAEVRRTEDELRRALARANGIMTASADAIVSIDKDQRITLFNEGAERMFGYPRSEAIGAPLEILIPDRLRAAHQKHVATFATGPDVARKMGARMKSLRGRRKDGSEFPADASICKLEVDGEQILTVTVRDITDQQRIEREQTFLADVGLVLAASLDLEDTLSQIAALSVRDFADLCVIDLRDDDGKIRRKTVVFRDPSKAWLADQLKRIPLDEDRPTLTSEAIQTGSTVLRTRIPGGLRGFAHSDHHAELIGAIAPTAFIAAPLIAHNTPIGAIAFVSSTPAHTFGQEDLRVAGEIARRAALAIENAQLYGVARRAIHARDEALGIVVHDLRNPLSAIGLQADLLLELGATEDRKAAELIRRSAKRMDRLIQDLLDVTRMEAHRLTVERAVLSANDTLAAIIDAQRPLAQKAGLEIDCEVEDDLPAVWADRDRLLQIFENLIGNALKFTGHGAITIGATHRSGEVLFWVRDTGSGIPADEVPHLFDRFWQGQRERRAGAGLGLAIVKGLVEAHGGRIWVESAPKRGSCFYFTIPVAPSSSWSEPAYLA